ncbi:putative metal-dependent hydrolase (urease superfamily) [Methanocella conradii HZ254]|uniref:Metal-dependent hydrolase (Urease superfamily) n=1 Tax=Methanocella conradii (strain DSM 24694 / JCM 17849 / CGMCC 1.5162 / HZ254) TaxID=1041930 RepID=H8I6D6_METCZ|nr:putative metal-dependent hydrolase (urease superfamily) [Methanocella conradii HZ254]
MLPITDDHMHINIIGGRGVEAIKEFRNAGGTHVFIVSLPAGELGLKVMRGDDFRVAYDITVEAARRASEHVKAYAVVGVHPAEFIGLAESMGMEKAYAIVKDGLEIAAEYVAEGKAVAIKSGRPHYPVAGDLWKASNDLMRYAMELCREKGCAIQLHTESEPETMKSISDIAKQAGMPPHRVIKHFSPPLVKECESLNVFPSVICSKGALEEALSQGTRFMLETDYIDDPRRPGAVLGPRTVPRKTKEAIRNGAPEEAFYKIHKDNPERSYGIKIEC